MPVDSPALRAQLIACLPSLQIEHVAAESGQRVVYFGRFTDSLIPADVVSAGTFLQGWQEWGQIVVKVVAGASADALTRMQAESAILAEVRPARFPRLHYSDLFTENPVTDDKLPAPLFVSIEEHIDSNPLTALMGEFYGDCLGTTRIAFEIADSLMPLWTHAKKYVHRDIKPANILIRPDRSVVVIDLGIVRETGGQGITADGWGAAPLTVDYAAPEHIANDKDAVSYKTDFFSIGVLMYQMISGSNPFRKPGMSDYETAQAVEHLEPPSLEALAIADRATSLLVERLMKKHPYQRPRTPEVLMQEISRLLEK